MRVLWVRGGPRGFVLDSTARDDEEADKRPVERTVAYFLRCLWRQGPVAGRGFYGWGDSS